MRSILAAPGSLLLPILLLVLLPSFAGAQSGERFTAEERITALDLVIGFGAPGTRPPQTDAEDFDVTTGERRLPVVSVETSGESWDVRIWIDVAITGEQAIRWAGDALAPQAEAWTELGEVTIGIADPEPRTLLAPTRDPALVSGALAELSLFPEGRDELRTLRHEALEAGDAETAGAAAAAERELVRRRHDALLRWIVEEPASGGRRVLVLVSEGFDVDPAAFYRAAGLDVPSSAGELESDVRSVARTLAAYGWTTVVVSPDPEASLRPKGVRIGKFLLSDRGILYQAHKKPDRARAFIELGESLLGQGELADAVETFEEALYHFADDPDTDEDQARALVGLAEAYRRQGDLRAAREALASAAELDPSRADGLATVAAELRARLRPLEELVETTAGHLVHGEDGLRDARIDLERRIRITAQLAGEPTGEVLPVEIEHDGGRRLRFPAWIRSSTPQRIAEARLRDLLDGEAVDGVLEVDLVLEAETGELRVEATPEAAESVVPRVSWLIGGPDSPSRFAHRIVEVEDGRVESRLEPEADDGPWVGVLVEDLASGAWGVAAADRSGD